MTLALMFVVFHDGPYKSRESYLSPVDLVKKSKKSLFVCV